MVNGLLREPVFYAAGGRHRLRSLLRERQGDDLTQQENILGSMPMGRLVIHMSWPIMISMLMQAIYNLVDSLFVVRISDAAFLALSYAYPVQSLMVAFCVGTGVGFSALLAKRLGQGDQRQANSAVFHGLLLYLGCWILFLLFGLFACRAYMDFCTDTAQVAEMGVEYLRICCCFSFGMCAQFPLERILQSTGHPMGFMIIQGSGAVINLIFDPILIFGFDMGVAGAAAATVAGQIIGALIGVFLAFRIRRQFPLSPRGFRLDSGTFAELTRVAAPAILMQSLSSVMSLGLNAIFRLWSETAVWVLGVYFKLQNFVFMPVFSINNGLVSIISYNYGASSRERVRGAVRAGLLIALIAAGVGCILMWTLASPLLVFCFQASPAALAMGIPALRLTALAFLPAAVSIICSASFQSLGRSRYSLSVSLLRYIILLLPAALLLVRVLPDWSFGAFLIAELATCAVSLALYGKLRREKIDTIGTASGGL